MRTILTALLLFSLASAAAQDAPASANAGRERPRDRAVPFPKAAEAVARADESLYQRSIEWTAEKVGKRYTAEFSVPFAWTNRQVLFRLASAPGPYEVRIDDRLAGGSRNGTLPVEFNITKYVTEGINRVTLTLLDDPTAAVLESWPHEATAPGAATVLSQPTIRLRDVFVSVRKAGDGFIGEVGMVVKTDALNPKTARIHYELRDTSGMAVKSGFQDITLSMRGEDTLRFVVPVPRGMLWSATSPLLYDLLLSTQIEGRHAEYLDYRIGFRTLGSDTEGRLLLNGAPQSLRTAEIAADLPTEALAQLKAEGINALKLRAGIVREGFYDDCDALGIYVIAQVPIDTSSSGPSIRKGGNPSNQPRWKEDYLDRTRSAYHIARRHPSVIALSLAERSANGINLYESYLEMKAREPQMPIIYPAAAGEWNSDSLQYEIVPAGR